MNSIKLSSASVKGGAGNDSIIFGAGTLMTGGAAANTYFFGTSDGNDTLSFASSGTDAAAYLTLNVDSAFGATTGFNYSNATSLVSMGTGGDKRYLFIAGASSADVSAGSQIFNLTFVTVSSSVITDLG